MTDALDVQLCHCGNTVFVTVNTDCINICYNSVLLLQSLIT